MRFLYRLNPFLKKFRLNQILLQKELEEDYSAYLELKRWFKGKQIKKDRLTVYYPASGGDISTCFAIYDVLVSKNKFTHFIFSDFRDLARILRINIRRYMPSAKIKESYEKGIYKTELYFKDRIIWLTSYQADANEFISPELKKGIDLYYERGFGGFREDTIQLIAPLMKNSGLMITDYGFYFGNLKDKFKQLKNIPEDFGLYHKFQIWQKTR